MKFADLFNYAPEAFVATIKYLRSTYCRKKETEEAFEKTIESLINEEREERGLKPYNPLEINSKNN